MKIGVSYGLVNWKKHKRPELRLLQAVFACEDWQVRRAVSRKLRVTIEECFAGFPPHKQRWVVLVRLRFGFDGHEIHTYPELGGIFGVSTPRARQLCEQALSVLRHPKHSRRLRSFLLTQETAL